MGRFLQGNIDPGLERIRLIEDGDRGGVGIVHVEHALLSGNRKQGQYDAIDGGTDLGSIQGQLLPVDLRPGAIDSGGKLCPLRFQSAQFTDQFFPRGGQGFDLALVGIEPQARLDQVSFGDGSGGGLGESLQLVLQFAAFVVPGSDLHFECLDRGLRSLDR